MKDIVLEGFVQSFAAARGLSHLDRGELFETFAASSIFRKYHQWDAVEMDDSVLVGGANDGGIDAIGILVNGRPARTEEDVEFFIGTLHRLEVEFIFIQAKSASQFKASDIGQFAFGVQQFFSRVFGNQQRIEFNAEITQTIELSKYIYRQSIKMQTNPQCYLYYASSGKWTGAPDPDGRLLACKEHLEGLKIFSSVTITAVDAELLKSIYRDLERSVDRQLEFSKTAVFPQIDGVEDAYIGLMRGDEFVKLVSRDDGELNRELFFDNVRDYQGGNPVNSDIRSTLSDRQGRRNFPLLNNGVTITARSINRRGDIFTIRDFQIVNGCQTTHILFQSKEHVDETIFIPVKLVATTDSQVVNEVIKATNRQTAVLPEALESLTSFHKELEDFYKTQERDRSAEDRIYYERRSKQFLMDNISQKNIVTLTNQIKSFVGMFLNEPHSHPRYYGELLQSYAGRIFLADHNPAPYYASGVALLMVEDWLNSNPSDRAWRPYRHQVLMLLRILIAGTKVPELNGTRATEYALGIVDALRDNERRTKECRAAIRILDQCLSEFNSTRTLGVRNPPHRIRAFTELLLRKIYGSESVQSELGNVTDPKLGSIEHGQIIWFDQWKHYGFIQRDSGDRIFVHGSQITLIPWHLRTAQTRVKYVVKENKKHPGKLMATNVTFVED